MQNKPIYLDYNATTPLDPEVLEAMLPILRDGWGNPSSSHCMGRAAAEAVATARQHVADLIGAKPEEIIFTSGATESDNIAVLGALRALGQPGHAVVSSIEHKAVLDACKQAGREGHSSTPVRPERDGRISPDAIEAALRPDTAVVSVMLGNNEIGVVNAIPEIGERVHARANPPLFHCDGAQGIGMVPLDVHQAQLDLLSISAHKMYGPKGVGALFVRSGLLPRVASISHGGGQERGVRSGTLNVHGIVGLGAACRIARNRMAFESRRIRDLRDRLLGTLQRRLQEVSLNGSLEHRLPGNLHLAFSFIDARQLIEALDGRVCASLGSACTSKHLEPSHVLRGLGIGNDRARCSLRLSTGRFTTEAEVDLAAEIIIAEVNQLRERSPVWNAAVQAS